MDNNSPTSSVIINIEQLIKTHISSIDRLETEVRKYAEMLQDIFTNDETYQKHDKESKLAAKIKSGTKQEILKQQHAKLTSDKVKTLKSEVKELEKALSDYLREYQRLTGVNEIEGEDGQVREIIHFAKLVRRLRSDGRP